MIGFMWVNKITLVDWQARCSLKATVHKSSMTLNNILNLSGTSLLQQHLADFVLVPCQSWLTLWVSVQGTEGNDCCICHY